MPWTTPRTWVTGEIPTATIFNTHLRDNLEFLRDVPAAAFPTSGVGEGERFTQIESDHQSGEEVTNEYVYLPSINATHPWHWVGGPGYRRLFGNVDGTSVGVWTNEGTIFTAPLTGLYDIRLEWGETNGPGESNGSIAVGTSGGTRWNAATVFDTASARAYRPYVQFRQTITKNDVIVLWMQINDAGNPANALTPLAEIKPIRGAA